MRTLPGRLHGVTIDNAGGAATRKINDHKAALSALPHMPTVRVVFDENVPPSEYTRWIAEISPVAYVMGELLDSYYLKKVTVAQYKTRVAAYLKAFPNLDLWEVGNEIGGNWTGPYTDTAAKVIAAHDLVKNAGQRSVLTLWENSWGPDHCGDGPAELTPQQWSAKYLPALVRATFDYVLLSWYPTLCVKVPDIMVPAATVRAEAEALHALFPNARIGFGEIGLPKRATASTLARAQSIAAYYYQLQIDLPYWCAGCFWWYWAKDAVPSSKPMWSTIANAMGGTP